MESEKIIDYTITTQEEFDEKIMDINLEYPKNSFNHFQIQMRENNSLKGNITKNSKEFSEKYKNLSKEKKKN